MGISHCTTDNCLRGLHASLSLDMENLMLWEFRIAGLIVDFLKNISKILISMYLLLGNNTIIAIRLSMLAFDKAVCTLKPGKFNKSV